MLGLKLIHVSKRGLSYQWSTLVAGLTNTLLNMSVMAFWITSNSTACSTVCSDKQHRNMKALHYWPFEMGIHQWLVDSPHKGPVMQKAFPCYDIMVDSPHKGPVMSKSFPCYDIIMCEQFFSHHPASPFQSWPHNIYLLPRRSKLKLQQSYNMQEALYPTLLSRTVVSHHVII